MASGAREKTVVWNYSCIKVDVDLGGTTGHVIDRGRAISDLGGRIPFLGDGGPKSAWSQRQYSLFGYFDLGQWIKQNTVISPDFSFPVGIYQVMGVVPHVR